jgi:hypothetical protein
MKSKLDEILVTDPEERAAFLRGAAEIERTTGRRPKLPPGVEPATVANTEPDDPESIEKELANAKSERGTILCVGPCVPFWKSKR